MKTMLQIIDETAKAYTSSTRATIEATSGCEYQNAKGYCCAVGRCMKDPLSVENSFVGDEDSSVAALDTSSTSGLDSFLKPEYQGHSVSFWVDIQGLHDNDTNWGKNGLSDQGKSIIQRIKDKWGEQ